MAEAQATGQQRLATGLGWFSVGLGLAEVASPGAVARFVGLRDSGGTRTVMRTFGAREIANGMALLASRPDPGWMWARVAGDVIDLSALGAAVGREDADRRRLAIGMASVAGVMLADLVCARHLGRTNGTAATTAPRQDRAIRVAKTFTINRPPDEVYAYWRNLDHLPRFMRHLQSVRETGSRRSHWVARGPAGMTFEWDAEITEDLPNQRIAWRSLPGADVDHRGDVRFDPAPGGRGTELRVHLEYHPPGGRAAARLAKLFGREPGQQVEEDLRRLKQLLEAGEIARASKEVRA